MPVDITELNKEAGQPVWLREADLSEWDEFVQGHPHGMVAHLSLWKRALEESFPHMEGRVCVLRDPASGAIRAGLPVYIVRSWLLGTRLVSIPHATLCDPLVAREEDCKTLFQAAVALLQDVKARSLQIKTCATADRCSSLGFQVSSYKHHYLDLLQPLEKIERGFSRMPIRRMISKAIKAGVTVRRAESEEDIRAFHGVFSESRQRLGLPAIPAGFLSCLLRLLGPERVCVLLASGGGRPVGGLLVTHSSHVAALEASGCSDTARDDGVVQLLYWEAIKEAHARGFKICSFGRTSPSNTGLIAHKRFWGTVEEDLPIYAYPASAGQRGISEGTRSFQVLQWVIRRSPPVINNLLSRFCYRHWA